MARLWQTLTWRGRLIAGLGIVATTVGVGLRIRPFLWLGLVLILVVIFAVAAVVLTVPRLELTRTVVPAQAPIGSTLRGRLSIVNLRRSPLYATVLFEEKIPLTMGDRARFVLPAEQGLAAHIYSYPIRGTRRGRFSAGPLHAEVRDPFGLARLFRGQARCCDFLVTPEVFPLTQLRSASGVGTIGEASPQQLGIMGEDDVLVREYRHGDDMRRVHWRQTAKHGNLMVRREEQSWDPSACLLLDSRTFAHAGTGAKSSFEWAVSAVASIALHLLECGYRVELLHGTGEVISSRSAPTTQAARHHFLEKLAEADQCGHASLQPLVQQASILQRGQLLIAVCGQLDTAEAALLASLRTPHTRALAIVLDSRSFHNRSTLTSKQAGVQVLDAGGWNTAYVTQGMSVPHAWKLVNTVRR